jgi:4-aminobutyrate aminotransferase-like enzyme/Ser/Thr protein kinase RdoA (MazF antagonist)
MSVLDHTPRFSLEQAQAIAADRWGLATTASPLPSERDQNFLLDAAGERFVLKISNGGENHALLDAQNRAMERIAGTGLCPRLLASAAGREIETVVAPSGTPHLVRLVTYLPGTPMGRVRRRTPGLLEELGRAVGRVDAALAGFDHPAIRRDFHWDLARGLEVVRAGAGRIADRELAAVVMDLAGAFERHAAWRLADLRRGVIHNDANDFNVLVGGGASLDDRNQHVVGLIDLGDMVHSFTVGDVAVAVAYAVMGEADPLVAASHVVRGYHAAFPLGEDELAVLWDLAMLRLSMSACIAAEQQAHRPDDPYLGISQGPIRATLPGLARIRPEVAEAVLRVACGLPPVEKGPDIAAWLAANTGRFAPVLGVDLRATPLLVLDLSVGSPLVDGEPARNAEPHLGRRVLQAMDEAGAQVGVGQYNEARYLYTSPAFATGDGPTDETRTVHLGIDLFAPPGTSVHAALDGIVAAFADNAAPQDYGPVVVLAHRAGNRPFFTLYGHLSRESLDALEVGRRVAKGERFATVGSSEVNGGWAPHLHFQVVDDLLGLGCGFPGVASPSQRVVWTALCPDPNLILGIPAGCFPPPEPDKAETLATRRARLGRNLSVAYREPVKVVRGFMQWLFDEQGRRHLDAYNNVAHVGHCHPRVVAAIRRQAGVLNTNTRYLHDFVTRYAGRLGALLPEPLSVCFFVNSASEANELALRLARAHTGQRDMIVLEAAYHGHTTGLIDIGPYKHDGPGGLGAPEWVHTVPIADPFRGPYRRDDPQAGERYAAHVAAVAQDLRARGHGLAGFIAESLPSVGGQIVFPPGYLAAAYGAVRAAGGVCIADEVQTGFGRLGTHLWGFETQGVVPDVVVLGKPIGNGHPLGAVVTTPGIAASFDNGMEFFSTFGGNPVSCAAGMAVLDVIEEEGLQAHALRVGERLLAGLRPLVDRHPLVGDVRGSGLFLGVELVRDRATLEPAAEEAAYVVNRLREHRILLGTDGPLHNVVKIRPPMPFDEANADFLVATFERILTEELAAAP